MNTLFCVVALSLAPQQCPGGVCPAPMVQVAPALEWKSLDPKIFPSHCTGLFQGPQQIGLYDFEKKQYVPWNSATQSWGTWTGVSPIPPPQRTTGAANDWRTCGVDKSKLTQERTYSSETGKVTPEKAFSAIGDTIDDDSHKLFVSFICTDGSIAKNALNDFKLKQPELAQTLHLKAYAANDPTVAESGFLSGTPMIYVQQGAKVIGREDGYPGAEKLAEAVRKKRADYDPAKDPKLFGNNLDLNGIIAKIKELASKHGVLIALIIVALMYFKKPTQPQPPTPAKA